MRKSARTTRAPYLNAQILKKLGDAAVSHVKGGQMMVNPRTDCICCKACATATC